MTKKSWRKSQGKSATRATGAEQSTKSTTKEKLPSPILKVLNDLYLIETDAPEKYDGNLHIPDMYKAFYENLPDTGIILSRGDTTRYQLPVGQKVRFGKHSGQRFKFNGKDLQLVREHDILASIG